MPQGLLQDLTSQVPLPDKITIAGTTVDVKNVDKAASQVLGNATDTVIDVSIALAIVIGGWLISRWLASAVQRALVRARFEETVAAFMGSLSRYAFFLMCVLGAFNVLGVSLTSAVAVFGAIGLAIAFALRNTLTHMASGLMLIVNRPFRVGDYIELETTAGTVKRITLFNTEINTTQNRRIFIPNTRIWENILQNHTYNEVRAVELKVMFSYEDDPEACKAMMAKVFEAEELILAKPEPYISTEEFKDNGVVYLFRFWVRTRDYGPVRQVILDRVWQGAKKKGLTMPYPHTVVHMAEPKAAAKSKGRK